MSVCPRWLASVVLVVTALAGCESAPRAAEGPAPGAAAEPASASSPRVLRRASEPPEPPEPAGPRASDGRPRSALLTIPALGLKGLRVVPYRGVTDDGPGTAIQDRGVAASPFGPRGGTGPGGIGNYQVTAHRTSATRAFEFLPSLRPGARVVVETGRRRFLYEVIATRRTSFRSGRSLAEQRAAVPGRPDREPTRAMITLSTCATQEDHAAGNYWSDEFHNPEHRIDKIGVLVRSRRA